MVSKRDDPDFQQVSGYVPSEIATEFRSVCVKRRLSVSSGVELALSLWIKSEDTEERPKRIRREREPAPITIGATLREAIANNLIRLRKAGIKNLDLLAKGEVLPTKADFAEIAATLKLDADTQKRLWDQAFNNSCNTEVTNGNA